MDVYEQSLKMHEEKKGKLHIVSNVPTSSKEDLSLAYTPGVAEPCRRINANPEDAFRYTIKSNMVGIVSDGSAVLGLGNIGGLASLPVMEGKAILFKNFGGVDAFPICLNTQDADEIVSIVKNIAPTFGGINLEDIAAPKCFDVEAKLQNIGIPVFHDDQHGTAVVTLAGLINAVKVVGKNFSDLKVVVSGSGAAGIACAKIILSKGVKDLILVDSKGIVSSSRTDLNPVKQEMLKVTNKNNVSGSMLDAFKDADIFVGVSAPGIVTEEMVSVMNKDAIVFAMANPVPEIMPDLALKAGAKVIGTGRSDFPNQVNNVLAFPGIFRGALDAKATRITEGMKLAAADALASMVSNPNPEKVIPSPLEPGVSKRVADAVMKKAIEEGVIRK